MRVRIEIRDGNQEDEIVIYCREITSQTEALVKSLERSDKIGLEVSFFKKDEQYFLQLSEILFFETEGDSVIAHSGHDSFETRKRLYELENILPGHFIRVSKSAIVNTRQIFSISRGITRVGLISFRESHKEIFVSRMYMAALKSKMEERMI